MYPALSATNSFFYPKRWVITSALTTPVRFIDAFVDGLDLVEAGFERVQLKSTGRPGYAPGDLLKLYIYGYLNRVRSSAGWKPNAIQHRGHLAAADAEAGLQACFGVQFLTP
jgi:hypothetical protein